MTSTASAGSVVVVGCSTEGESSAAERHVDEFLDQLLLYVSSAFRGDVGAVDERGCTRNAAWW